MRALMSVAVLVLITGMAMAQEPVVQTSLWDCSPKKILPTDDPVARISLTITIQYQGDARPLVTRFDAWHWTAKGNVYKRSELYVDKDAWVVRDLCHEATTCPNYVQLSGFSWHGVWNKNRNIEMLGALMRNGATGLYEYREATCLANAAGPSVCSVATEAICSKSNSGLNSEKARPCSIMLLGAMLAR